MSISKLSSVAANCRMLSSDPIFQLKDTDNDLCDCDWDGTSVLVKKQRWGTKENLGRTLQMTLPMKLTLKRMNNTLLVQGFRYSQLHSFGLATLSKRLGNEHTEKMGHYRCMIFLFSFLLLSVHSPP